MKRNALFPTSVASHLIAVGFGLVAIISISTMAAELPVGVEVGRYNGWDDAVTLQGKDAEARAVITPSAGGRIVEYSLDGDSILYQAPGTGGKTLANTPDGFAVSGYQIDLGPEILGVPKHETLWLGPWSAKPSRDYGVTLTSLADPALGVQIVKEIVIDPDAGDLGINQTLKNVSGQDVSFCMWDRTLVRGGGFAFFPVNKKSRFKAKWSQRRTVDGRYVYDGDKPDSENVKIIDGILVAKAGGPATKIGADSDAGWIAYAMGRLLFIKYFPHSKTGEYSDGGNSVEVYWDERFGEIEPLSPEVKLRPGESYNFPEKWVLLEIDKPIVKHMDARNLVKLVPPSPFKH
ncbi:MAG TPA: hypothetical protein VK968_18735 [Roseimicrobium sp.]|nr:hypothetical protein [Roseimicrobium sp.]